MTGVLSHVAALWPSSSAQVPAQAALAPDLAATYALRLAVVWLVDAILVAYHPAGVIMLGTFSEFIPAQFCSITFYPFGLGHVASPSNYRITPVCPELFIGPIPAVHDWVQPCDYWRILCDQMFFHD